MCSHQAGTEGLLPLYLGSSVNMTIDYSHSVTVFSIIAITQLAESMHSRQLKSQVFFTCLSSDVFCHPPSHHVYGILGFKSQISYLSHIINALVSCFCLVLTHNYGQLQWGEAEWEEVKVRNKPTRVKEGSPMSYHCMS